MLVHQTVSSLFNPLRGDIPMKKSLMLAFAFLTLTAAAATPRHLPTRFDLRDGGGVEPGCPPTVCPPFAPAQ